MKPLRLSQTDVIEKNKRADHPALPIGLRMIGPAIFSYLFLSDLLILDISLNFARFASEYRLLSAA